MRNLDLIFRNREFNYNKLLEYGFNRVDNRYILKNEVYNNQFEMIVEISEKIKKSKLIDLANGEEYILVDIEESTGEFVGRIKQEYENKLQDIIDKCTTFCAFKSKQAKEIIKHIKQKYGDELEFLWEKFDNNAIWRNKQNDKWYGLLINIPKSKLGLESDDIVEIIDLRYQKGDTESIVDNVKIYPGYHMNKKSWITIILDETLDTKEIFKLIDNSYKLSIGNKSGLSSNNLSKKVYEYLTLIPSGKVVTYKQVAEYLGNKELARVVGNILHKNPDGDKYPCYKILNSKGELAESFVFRWKKCSKRKIGKRWY